MGRRGEVGRVAWLWFARLWVEQLSFMLRGRPRTLQDRGLAIWVGCIDVRSVVLRNVVACG